MAQGQNTAAAISAALQVLQASAAAAKPGVKTSEFWGMVAATTVAAIPGILPPPYNAIAMIVLPSIYTIARTFIKSQTVTLPDMSNLPPLPVNTGASNVLIPPPPTQPGRM